jgi:prepilin-type N-terminal cleavage/methylation domain-containing protein
MISLKKRQSGFTIVELLIVIVVIGILAALVITTYGGIQSKARNSKRQVDLQSLQTQLEAFFSQNGFYPSNADINGSVWRAAQMKSLDIGAMTDPLNPGQANPQLKITTAVAADKQYSYVVTDSAGASCEATDTNCAKYVLTAPYEGTVNGATFYTKANLD